MLSFKKYVQVQKFSSRSWSFAKYAFLCKYLVQSYFKAGPLTLMDFLLKKKNKNKNSFFSCYSSVVHLGMKTNQGISTSSSASSAKLNCVLYDMLIKMVVLGKLLANSFWRPQDCAHPSDSSSVLLSLTCHISAVLHGLTGDSGV